MILNLLSEIHEFERRKGAMNDETVNVLGKR
jgi:hypothetical protein